MKQSIKRVLIASTCVALSGGAAYGIGTLTNTSDTTTSEVAVNSDDESVSTDAQASSKQETVYVVSDAYGNAESITVSNYLKNEDGETYIKDTNNLTDVKDVKGDSTYDAKTGEWKTDGSDVYYQGTSNKQLPVTMSITYKLDGKTVNPEDIKGKSGKLEMTYTYTNNEEVTVDGQKVCVPFVVLTGMILDNDVFSNVKVTNGKVEDDGDKRVVIGYAMPGVQDALGVSSKDYSIPSEFTITANVKKFDLGMSMTYVDNSIFNSLDKASSSSDLTDKLNTLNDSLNSLMDGTNQLYEGLNTLLTSVKGGTSSIDTLVTGAAALDAGLQKLTANSQTLRDGANTVYTNGPDLIQAKVEKDLNKHGLTSSFVNDLTWDNYKTEFNTLKEAVGTEVTPLATSVVQYSDFFGFDYTLNPSDESTVKANKLTAYQILLMNATLEQDSYATLKNAMKTLDFSTIDLSNAQTQAVVGQLTSLLTTIKTTYSDYDTTKATISTYVKNKVFSQTKVDDTVSMVQTKQKIAYEKYTNNETGSITNPYNQIYGPLLVTGNKNLSNMAIMAKVNTAAIKQIVDDNKATIESAKTSLEGLATLNAGVDEYTKGVDQAASSTPTLLAGVKKLQSTWSDLVAGVKKLTTGSKKLNTGVQKFKSVDKAIDKFNALVDASKGYTSYCGSSNSTSVRFIIRTDVTE